MALLIHENYSVGLSVCGGKAGDWQGVGGWGDWHLQFQGLFQCRSLTLTVHTIGQH